MKANDIHLDDWARILVGNVPGSFYIEVLIRLLFIYLLLITSMRLMGNRMASTLGRNELAAMVVMAAGIGVPIQAPERGLIPAVIIAAIVVLTQRAISARAFKHPLFEKQSQGNISTLIVDGVMDVRAMEKARISRERLMAELRSNGIRQLGTVKRLYLEAGGDFSLSKTENGIPGLSCIPGWDKELIDEQKKSLNVKVCEHCGKQKQQETGACSNCGKNIWVDAVEQ